jgi:hypothetical protein
MGDVFEIADWSRNQVERSSHAAILSPWLRQAKAPPHRSQQDEASICSANC